MACFEFLALDLKNAQVSEGDGNGVKADVTFTVSDDDFVELVSVSFLKHATTS